MLSCCFVELCRAGIEHTNDKSEYLLENGLDLKQIQGVKLSQQFFRTNFFLFYFSCQLLLCNNVLLGEQSFPRVFCLLYCSSFLFLPTQTSECIFWGVVFKRTILTARFFLMGSYQYFSTLSVYFLNKTEILLLIMDLLLIKTDRRRYTYIWNTKLLNWKKIDKKRASIPVFFD